jgi:ATP-dependent 26S proteasome regulatory subunit
MTTNYIIRLDEALIWPSYIDKKVELRLTNNIIIANLFYLIFKLV